MVQRAIVIGAGISGLAASVRLAAMGMEVTLFDKNRAPGGKMGEIREKGFRFDTGPSLFTLPELLHELPSTGVDQLDARRLKTITRYHFPDGTVFDAPAERKAFERAVSGQLGEQTARVRAYLDNAENLYNQTSGLFIFSAFQRYGRLFSAGNLGVLKALVRSRPHLSMHAYNRRTFSREKCVQIFDRYATYNGSDPYKAPSTLNMISHLEHNLGAWFPKGGMYRIVEHLEKLALSGGVKTRYGERVEEILIQQGMARGVRTTSGKAAADLIVYAGDIRRAYTHLLPGVNPPRSIKNKGLSSSAMIFYLGYERAFPELELHNIFFAGDYKEEFRALSRKGPAILHEDPTVYIYNSSVLEPGDAPPGGSNLFVMINTPHSRGEDWEALVRKARGHIFKKLKREFRVDLNEGLVLEKMSTPQTIEQQSLSSAGALYGNHSNSVFSAFNRHPNFSRRIPNLFFAGGSVHPGGGIPLCLASAKIVEDELTRYLKKKERV